jgi:hypothetical protein
MGTRTVRLDEEAERTLARLRKMTGLSISEVLKRGLIAYRAQTLEDSRPTPYEIYRQLELGEGGYAMAAAKEAKPAVREIIRRKHAR